METHIEGPSGSIDVTDAGTEIKGPSGTIKVTNGIKEGDTMSQAQADNVVKNGGGHFAIIKEGEESFLSGPNGLKIKIGDKVSAKDIETLSQHAPKAVEGETTVSASESNAPPGNTETAKQPNEEVQHSNHS